MIGAELGFFLDNSSHSMRAIVGRCILSVVIVACATGPLHAQDSTTRHWYDRLTFRGYAQFRYNRLFETNEKLKCSTCDRSIGEDGGFLLRRARLAITGQISDRVSVAILPDFSTEVGGRENTLVLRHYYADIVLDQSKTLRARIGQSEVPVGFEAVQSSSRRGPLDRADAIESLAPGEQDLGIFVFWTPATARERFRRLATNQFKGTGDYGVVAVGVYNGQGGNRAEANDAPHIVARLTYPFLVGATQLVELGGAAYTGTYTVTEAQRTAGVGGDADIDDRRASASLVIYPQPLGLEAEWMVGRGPRYEASTNSIIEGPQRGGYAMISYVISGRRESRLTAYARAQYFSGAFKTERDARSTVVREYEPGVEWTIEPALELTAAYAISDRHYRHGENPDNRQRGRFLRLQAQVNF